MCIRDSLVGVRGCHQSPHRPADVRSHQHRREQCERETQRRDGEQVALMGDEESGGEAVVGGRRFEHEQVTRSLITSEKCIGDRA